MKVTLQVKGREMTFSEEELISILEKYFEEQQSQVRPETIELALTPTEGKWFMVDPLSIDQKLFEEVREDYKQEYTRQLILESFEEMKKNPKYAKKFKTMIPKDGEYSRTVGEIKALAKSFGDHNADWVEQALEWAQRIQNGETWEDICNKYDTTNYYRVIVWKNGYARLVGGSRINFNGSTVTNMHHGNFSDGHNVRCAAPLVVLYE